MYTGRVVGLRSAGTGVIPPPPLPPQPCALCADPADPTGRTAVLLGPLRVALCLPCADGLLLLFRLGNHLWHGLGGPRLRAALESNRHA